MIAIVVTVVLVLVVVVLAVLTTMISTPNVIINTPHSFCIAIVILMTIGRKTSTENDDEDFRSLLLRVLN